MQKYAADANIGLRILVGNHDVALAKSDAERAAAELMYLRTRSVLQKVNNGEIVLVFTDAVIEEMVFVMDRIYKVAREKISSMILLLIEADGVEASTTIRDTLRLFAKIKLDFVDIKLSVISKELGIPILTWDKGFKQLDNCEYYAPSELSIQEDEGKN
ncbi:hypothetical protein PV433_18310 [Paenibacillus sp. GYB004]|uniref:hypothetical protein n=1 Tax=Paenibacillus sp. GYB004 TaxID=2994393 RepID=UPI002F967442